MFMRVINGAMTRPLNYDYLKSLPPAPQRFYEILSYQMYATIKHDRARAKLTYSDFCAHAPQTRHVKWDSVRSQMNKVHRPHLQSGYILDVDYQDTVDSDGQPDWIMLYKPGPKAKAEFRAFTKRGGPTVLEVEPFEPLALPDVMLTSELERELVQHGVSDAIAVELARDHDEAKIRQQLEILEWRLSGKKADKIEDPAAWLVSAIRSPNGHAAPKGFITKAQREEQEAARQAKAKQADEERRRKKEEAAREKAEQQTADAYYESLTAEEKQTLDAELNALVDPDQLAIEMKTPAIHRMGQLLRRRAHIGQLLKTRLPLPAEA
jgi:hypothetical protein